MANFWIAGDTVEVHVYLPSDFTDDDGVERLDGRPNTVLRTWRVTRDLMLDD